MVCFTRLMTLVALHIATTLGYEDESEVMGMFPKKEHSLVTPFQGSGMTLPYWNIFGNSVVTSGHIRLTSDNQARYGGIWNNVPLKFVNWEMHLHFKIHGKSTQLFGDGFAIWYLCDPLKPGPIFGSSDYFCGLGIFVDTYSNSKTALKHFPYIWAIVNNGTMHIDYDNDGGNAILDGCEANVRGVHDTHLSVRFDNEELIVKTDIEGSNQWKECFKLKGVRLPTNGFLGLSASTGDLSDNHDILSLKVYELEVRPHQVGEQRDSIVPSARPRTVLLSDSPSKISNLVLFLIIFFSIISFVFLAVLLYLYYETKKERDYKRFY